MVMMIVDIRTDNPEQKFSAYQPMVNAIIGVMKQNGGCLPQDLLPLGFSKDETVDQWRMAYALACSL